MEKSEIKKVTQMDFHQEDEDFDPSSYNDKSFDGDSPIIRLFNEHFDLLRIAIEQENIEMYSAEVNTMFNFFSNESSTIFKYALERGLVNFLLDIAKRNDEFFSKSIYLMIGLCNDRSGQITITLVNDNHFMAIIEGKLQELTVENAEIDLELIRYIIYLLYSFYYDCSTYKNLIELEIQPEVADALIRLDSQFAETTILMLSSFTKYKSEFNQALNVIAFVVPLLKDLEHIDTTNLYPIPNIIPLLVQIKLAIRKQPDIVVELQQNTEFLEIILDKATRPTIYKSPISKLPIEFMEKAQKNSQEAARVILECLQTPARDLVINKLAGYIDSFLDMTREDDFLALAAEICSELVLERDYALQLILDRQILDLVNEWLNSAPFTFKLRAMKLLTSILMAAPPEVNDQIFEKILTPKLAEEIASILMDSDQSELIYSCMFLCRIFVQKALEYNSPDAIEQLRNGDLSEICHTIVIEMFEDDKDKSEQIHEIIAYLDEVLGGEAE